MGRHSAPADVPPQGSHPAPADRDARLRALGPVTDPLLLEAVRREQQALAPRAAEQPVPDPPRAAPQPRQSSSRSTALSTLVAPPATAASSRVVTGPTPRAVAPAPPVSARPRTTETAILPTRPAAASVVRTGTSPTTGISVQPDDRPRTASPALDLASRPGDPVKASRTVLLVGLGIGVLVASGLSILAVIPL